MNLNYFSYCYSVHLPTDTSISVKFGFQFFHQFIPQIVNNMKEQN